MADAGKAAWKQILSGTGYRRVRFEQLLEVDIDELDDAKAIHVLPVTKSHPVLFRLRGEYRHGILKKRWSRYEQVPVTKRRLCFVALVEFFKDETKQAWSGNLLLQGVKQLGKPCPAIANTALDDSVLFPCERFVTIGRVQADWLLTGRLPDEELSRLRQQARRVLRRCAEKQGLF